MKPCWYITCPYCATTIFLAEEAPRSVRCPCHGGRVPVGRAARFGPAEWLTQADPGLLLAFVRESVSARKLRLFTAACLRSVWPSVEEAGCQRHVEAAEQGAEGAAGAAAAARGVVGIPPWLPYESMTAAEEANRAALWAAGTYRGKARLAERRRQADFLRDLLGDPFRASPPRAAAPSALGGTVFRLAQAAYDNRRLPEGRLDPARLAVLADALEESGHADPALIEHLRSGGPHVRGCHVVDALVGRS